MLKSSEDAATLSNLLHRQEVAIDMATRLLNGLLDISRLESGAIEPQLSPVSLAEVFSDLAGEFESAAASNDLRLEFPETQIVLSTDRTLLAQILQNLVGNALKYTKCGFVRISQTMESDALMLDIEDSGVGIPEGKLDRIFDEYYQVNTQGTQRLGVGLGLAIVREVSRLLGYSISVSSKLDEGTRVRVRVPGVNILSDRHVPPRAEKNAGTVESLAKCRVVLLEDNDSVRAATELFLTLEGYETLAAASAAEAERLLAALQPGDVFITDYHLDGKLTGLEVLSQLRLQKERDVPAILLSGDLHSIMRAIKTPIACCRFLSKPVDTKALLAAIAELSRP
jgi:CheY-like chemotaxis protein/two-component sensor histidine kinase